MKSQRCWAVVPAAGLGKRMGAAIPKQYLPLQGCAVIAHALMVLLQHPRIHGVAVAINTDDAHWPKIATTLITDKPLWVVAGGAERCHSVLNGLASLRQQADPMDWVLVHDAVRPCLTSEEVDRLLTELADDPVGGLLAVPVRDTLKRADANGRVATTVDRSQLWHALTPQMFRLGLLQEALNAALVRDVLVTDEAAAMEAAGFAPRLVMGCVENLKITQPDDLMLAEFYLSHRKRD